MSDYNFGDGYLRHVAAPIFDPDQILQSWDVLADIPNSLFDTSTELIDDLSTDFGTYDMSAPAGQPGLAVPSYAASSSSNPAFPLQQSSSWNIPYPVGFAEPLPYAAPPPYTYPPHAFQTVVAFPHPVPSQLFLNTTLTPAFPSQAPTDHGYENGAHIWSESMWEGGKYVRRCKLCNKSVRDNLDTRKRHELSMRHQSRLPKTKRLDRPPLKCSICGLVFKSRRRFALQRHIHLCHPEKPLPHVTLPIPESLPKPQAAHLPQATAHLPVATHLPIATHLPGIAL